MKINSVIFDMDGVIIDSEPHWTEAQVSVLAKYGVPGVTEADCDKYTRGTRLQELAGIWIRLFKLPVKAETLAEEILERVCRAIEQEGAAMEGLYGLLDYLKAEGIRSAVATSSDPRIIQTVFDRLQLWHYFELQCSAADEQYGKPHPAVYLKAVEKLGIEKNDCIVIEDSVTGLIAAKAAGLRTFIVNPNYQEDRFAIADERFPSLIEVIKRLDDD